ncbi:hypothetical protein EDD86DRAFT_200428 [Gorgonomyces haynaldii]|nr:hypothetical protein EDD86DRAFT_200428 [Gorgonomyces haynaldii]
MNWLIFASTTLSQADYTESFAKYQNLVIFLSFVWSLPFSMYAIFYQPPDGMPRIFGDAVTWCNINSPVYPNFLFAFYYGWQWLVFLFGILTTFMAWLNLYKMGKRTVSMRAFVIKKMTVYIIVFFIGHIFSNINRMNAMLHGTEIFILPVLQGVFSPSRGFLNFLAFLVVSRFQFHRSQSESVSKQIKSMNDQQLLPIPSNPVMSSEI